jgi:hypothetical protein
MKFVPVVRGWVGLMLAMGWGGSGCLAMRIMDSQDRKHFAEINTKRETAHLRPLSWEEFRHAR